MLSLGKAASFVVSERASGVKMFDTWMRENIKYISKSFLKLIIFTHLHSVPETVIIDYYWQVFDNTKALTHEILPHFIYLDLIPFMFYPYFSLAASESCGRMGVYR